MRSEDAVAAMLCPICRISLTLSERQGVEIDYCGSCRGVWLGRGEIDKIVERSVAADPPARHAAEPSERWAAGDGDDYRDGYRRHGQRKRKKSFLSEFFD